MIGLLIDGVNSFAYHYKNKSLNWASLIYIALAHVAAIVGLFTVPYCDKWTIFFACLLYPTTMIMGITAGVHRLWSHRSYKATLPLRVVLMIFNSIANQGSIWHWARDHRVHHKHSDTNGDPHNAHRGFFFAHMGWLFVKKHQAVVDAGKTLNYDDLAEDATVMFQKKYDPWWNLFMCFVFPGLVVSSWGASFWHGFWVAGALRYIIVLHFTWLVNSAAHLYGDHPYDPSMLPAENPVVSSLVFGEGWHNWHHKYPYDYAASEFGISKQFNGAKLFIDICCALGLAYDRKRGTGAWSKLREKREQEIYGVNSQQAEVRTN